MQKTLFLPCLLLFLVSCSNPLVINPDNYTVVGAPGTKGLQAKESGELVLPKEYQDIRLQHDFVLDEYYLAYETNDGKKGFFLEDLNQPTIEVSNDFSSIELINSKQYFAFTKPQKNKYGYFSKGVIDKDKNIIIENKYLQILHDGNQLFFASKEETDKEYQVIGKEGQIVNTNQYKIIHSRFGVTFASKFQGGSLWGAEGCLLDANGKEITAHLYQSVAVRKCFFDKSKIYLSMRKNGISTLYYPNGKRIYSDSLQQILPLDQRIQKMHGITMDQLPQKNLIGLFSKDKETYYLTYEGEALKAVK